MQYRYDMTEFSVILHEIQLISTDVFGFPLICVISTNFVPPGRSDQDYQGSFRFEPPLRT